MIRVNSCVDNEIWDLLSTGFQAQVAEYQCVENWSESDWRDIDTVRIVVVRSAEYSVAQGIRDGLSVKEAEQQWERTTHSILKGQRLNRRFNKLVLLDDAAAAPEHFAETLKEFGIEFKPTNAQDVVQDIALLAAQASVAQNTELLDLNKKLTISALPITQALTETPVDAIVAEIMLSEREKNSMKAQVRQLESAQEDSAKVEALESEQQALKEENELLQLQLEQVQEKLEHTFTDLKQAQQDLSDVTAERNDYRSEFDKLKKVKEAEASKRDASKLEATETELQTLKEENELLLLQLQQVQEELEQYYLRSKSLENEASAAKAQLDKARALKTKWSEMKESMSAELSDLKAKIEQKDSKLHELSQKRKQEKARYSADFLKHNELKTDFEALKREIVRVREELLVAEEITAEKVQSLKLKDEKIHDFSQKREQALEQVSQLEKKVEQKDEKLRWFGEKLRKERDNRANIETRLKLVQLELRDTKARAQVPAVKSRRMRDYLAKVKRIGRSKQRDGQVKQARERKQIDFIRQSHWFDPVWYLRQYPDILEAEIDPAEHYYYFGGFEGRDPGPEFNSQYYIESNADVAEQQVNPLVHYIMFGREEGRLARPALLELADNPGSKDDADSLR